MSAAAALATVLAEAKQRTALKGFLGLKDAFTLVHTGSDKSLVKQPVT